MVLARAPRGYRAIGCAAANILRVVPDGDTVHRSAAALRTALVGRQVARFDAPSLYGPRPSLRRVVELVECHGRHLEITWDDELVLHTHLRIGGAWHLYRVGEPWRKSSEQAHVVIEVPEWVAVCFNASLVETYRQYDRYRHPGFGRLGPDLSSAGDIDLLESARELANYPFPDTTIAEALLDQHVVLGLGNVFRSEVLWACGISPFATVGSLSPTECAELVYSAARLLRADYREYPRDIATEMPVDAGHGHAVYGRNGQPCTRCGDSVEVRRVGAHSRLLYWCPGCQLQHRPHQQVADSDAVREMDPHPAAAKYLADLPWRRDSLAG